MFYIQKFKSCFLHIYRSCLQENSDLKSTKTELNTLLVRQREEQDAMKKVKSKFRIKTECLFGVFLQFVEFSLFL